MDKKFPVTNKSNKNILPNSKKLSAKSNNNSIKFSKSPNTVRKSQDELEKNYNIEKILKANCIQQYEKNKPYEKLISLNKNKNSDNCKIIINDKKAKINTEKTEEIIINSESKKTKGRSMEKLSNTFSNKNEIQRGQNIIKNKYISLNNIQYNKQKNNITDNKNKLEEKINRSNLNNNSISNIIDQKIIKIKKNKANESDNNFKELIINKNDIKINSTSSLSKYNSNLKKDKIQKESKTKSNYNNNDWKNKLFNIIKQKTDINYVNRKSKISSKNEEELNKESKTNEISLIENNKEKSENEPNFQKNKLNKFELFEMHDKKIEGLNTSNDNNEPKSGILKFLQSFKNLTEPFNLRKKNSKKINNNSSINNSNIKEEEKIQNIENLGDAIEKKSNSQQKKQVKTLYTGQINKEIENNYIDIEKNKEKEKTPNKFIEYNRFSFDNNCEIEPLGKSAQNIYNPVKFERKNKSNFSFNEREFFSSHSQQNLSKNNMDDKNNKCFNDNTFTFNNIYTKGRFDNTIEDNTSNNTFTTEATKNDKKQKIYNNSNKKNLLKKFIYNNSDFFSQDDKFINEFNLSNEKKNDTNKKLNISNSKFTKRRICASPPIYTNQNVNSSENYRNNISTEIRSIKYKNIILEEPIHFNTLYTNDKNVSCRIVKKSLPKDIKDEIYNPDDLNDNLNINAEKKIQEIKINIKPKNSFNNSSICNQNTQKERVYTSFNDKKIFPNQFYISNEPKPKSTIESCIISFNNYKPKNNNINDNSFNTRKSCKETNILNYSDKSPNKELSSCPRKDIKNLGSFLVNKNNINNDFMLFNPCDKKNPDFNINNSMSEANFTPEGKIIINDLNQDGFNKNVKNFDAPNPNYFLQVKNNVESPRERTPGETYYFPYENNKSMKKFESFNSHNPINSSTDTKKVIYSNSPKLYKKPIQNNSSENPLYIPFEDSEKEISSQHKTNSIPQYISKTNIKNNISNNLYECKINNSMVIYFKNKDKNFKYEKENNNKNINNRTMDNCLNSISSNNSGFLTYVKKTKTFNNFINKISKHINLRTTLKKEFKDSQIINDLSSTTDDVLFNNKEYILSGQKKLKDNYIREKNKIKNNKSIIRSKYVNTKHSFFSKFYNISVNYPSLKNNYISKEYLKIIKIPIKDINYLTKCNIKLIKYPFISVCYLTKIKTLKPKKIPKIILCNFSSRKYVSIQKKTLSEGILNSGNINNYSRDEYEFNENKINFIDFEKKDELGKNVIKNKEEISIFFPNQIIIDKDNKFKNKIENEKQRNKIEEISNTLQEPNISISILFENRSKQQNYESSLYKNKKDNIYMSKILNKDNNTMNKITKKTNGNNENKNIYENNIYKKENILRKKNVKNFIPEFIDKKEIKIEKEDKKKQNKNIFWDSKSNKKEQNIQSDIINNEYNKQKENEDNNNKVNINLNSISKPLIYISKLKNKKKKNKNYNEPKKTPKINNENYEQLNYYKSNFFSNEKLFSNEETKLNIKFFNSPQHYNNERKHENKNFLNYGENNYENIEEQSPNMPENRIKYEIINLLNVITENNYICIQDILLSLMSSDKRKSKNESTTKEIMYLFSEIVINQVIIGKKYVKLFAKLCYELNNCLSSVFNNNQSNDKITDLKDILREKSFVIFNEVNNLELISIKEESEEYINIKNKFLGIINFINELVEIRLLSENLAIYCIEQLFSRYYKLISFINVNDYKAEYLSLDSVIFFLSKTGKFLYNEKSLEKLEKIEKYIKEDLNNILLNSKNNGKFLPSNIKFKIFNLIEKQKNSWKDSLTEKELLFEKEECLNNNENDEEYYYNNMF